MQLRNSEQNEQREREVRAAPAEQAHPPRREQRPGNVASADAGDGEAGGEGPVRREPRLHRSDRRHVGQAHADTDAHAVRHVQHPERLRAARHPQRDREARHADERHPPRAIAIRGHAGRRAGKKPEKGRDREHERDLTARGAELDFQRAEERGERVCRAEADEHQGEGRRHHHPAVRIFVHDPEELRLSMDRDWRVQ
jgi:hypothetical protein